MICPECGAIIADDCVWLVRGQYFCSVAHAKEGMKMVIDMDAPGAIAS